MDLFWIDRSLAIASRPRGGDWLDDEMADFRRQGVDLDVSCLTPSEETELALTGEMASAARHGIAFLRVVMEDRGVPLSTAAVAEVVDRINDQRALRGGVAVHCRQGLGRAPLIVAATLVRTGMLPDVAWTLIAERRGQTVPDTDEQREWIQAFADHRSAGVG